MPVPEDEIRRLAQAILDRLGQSGQSWRVTETAPVGRTSFRVPEEALDGVVAVESEVVFIADSAAEQPETLAAHFTLGVDRAEAIMSLASQLQDHLIETASGDPIPPCPGHPHPLVAHVVAGEPVWECPQSPVHHRELIVPPD
ncbi:hypothetical protein [Streptomyces griseomycini]|uniref:Uncharacterized protein n=1 Tax=Streptomyces griseomycini TaxID=66895 RepID=A0A7W7PWJ9_9ACTN|nr:hypothetical protein [Streptomyces griseomycini]MBB4902632.1 hypothetical protein [Streptomyces griseomycini]GGQ35391.1 hypothetical protein GCM10010266_68610 [Streptomyces griseomycini]GGR60041.1 hypothetical protein GCM10015536_75280 [Streptomyces griseomycini]